jgi:hypothetical protein
MQAGAEHAQAASQHMQVGAEHARTASQHMQAGAEHAQAVSRHHGACQQLRNTSEDRPCLPSWCLERED